MCKLPEAGEELPNIERTVLTQDWKQCLFPSDILKNINSLDIGLSIQKDLALKVGNKYS